MSLLFKFFNQLYPEAKCLKIFQFLEIILFSNIKKMFKKFTLVKSIILYISYIGVAFELYVCNFCLFYYEESLIQSN